ncbi:outer membrane protein assembly factor BamB [Legionella longbeachae]|uniref:Outer membrane protein assembly factor BamB n=1 Tax=Legionella longbeachae serogroup 1 (strain NSW150) TaxID=661367 RepID=D3HSL3_LEGLN|nr:outer membrane protein assembly factor BamB [Legionella longbeachae]VEE02396.1 PQQ (pyrrolo-quinoline quinone) enzyme repeat protein [Legionella oakridgensis]HBD7398113.1 outer membrane protein assembly factor BamB [Legionella pneumophila]ARB91323.1 outer membrane protein assembly factor BamB [Legionella longbeachae]ARM32253.1 outer membrane protein assembly factor BamB [Legionella longbeachae]EEZ94964.1 outer membrane assembly lipoprotein YfgL [Legionella longbeachae D-4968]
MKIKFFILLFLVMAQGCSKLDDYMLGKDNTPKPKELKEIQDKIKVSNKWTVSVGKVSKNNEYLRLKPVVQSGTIYIADASGLVQAVNKSNGEIKWTTPLKHGLVSGPTIANGYIALGTSNSSVVVLNQSNGKKLWQAKVSGEILSPPTITHRKVIVKTIDGKVYSFDVVSGKELWTAEHGSPSLILKASSSPIVMGNLLLIGFSDGKLDALDIDTGRVIWQRSIVYAAGSSDVERLVDIDADPIVESNVVYLATYQGFIGALSLSDGQFLWKKPGSVYKNMVLSGNTLYVTDSHDVIWSLDKHSGRVNWKQTALKARILTEPALINNDIVVGDKTGYLHFLDSQTGEVLARAKISGGISISPTVIGNQLYVLTDNGMLNQLSVS